MRIDFTPDRSLYPFESRWVESSIGHSHYVDEESGTPILLCHGNPTWSFQEDAPDEIGEAIVKFSADVDRRASMQEIDRTRVQELIAAGAQIVEVLPASEYEEDHLPGAINMPLRKLEAEARTALDPKRPVVVYCWDTA